MFKWAFVIGLALGLCGTAEAQDLPRLDVFGGYSYASIDTNGLTSRQGANGWEASVSGNVSRWFAAEGDFSGYYKTYPLNDVDATGLGLGFLNGNVAVHDFAFMGGPRVNYGPLFVHGLFGFDRLTGHATGTSDEIGPFDVTASQNSFAAAFGGGVQQRVAPHWALRASADYVLTRHNIFRVVDPSAPAFTQDNFRVSVGIVFTFGGEREVRGRSRAQSSRAPAENVQATGTSEAALLGVSGHTTEEGFAVTSVRDGSPAAQAGIESDDVITGIDDRPVHTSAEIESAIAANQSGTVKVTFLIVRGQWLTTKEVRIR